MISAIVATDVADTLYTSITAFVFFEASRPSMTAMAYRTCLSVSVNRTPQLGCRSRVIVVASTEVSESELASCRVSDVGAATEASALVLCISLTHAGAAEASALVLCISLTHAGAAEAPAEVSARAEAAEAPAEVSARAGPAEVSAHAGATEAPAEVSARAGPAEVSAHAGATEAPVEVSANVAVATEVDVSGLGLLGLHEVVAVRLLAAGAGPTPAAG